jgi:hypothetical protein
MKIEEVINQYNGNSDYMDMNTGYIYHIQSWARGYKLFGMNLPLEVSQNGTVIETVTVDLDLVNI